MGPDSQTKEGNLIIEGVLRLGQYASAPSGTEGALYFNTSEKKMKVYSNTAWGDLGGGWDGVLPNYTTAQKNALSLADGLIVYNTTDKTVQIYASGVWTNIGGKLSSGVLCSLDGDCDSTHCIDGVCCDTGCDGNCNRCNIAGSEGICTDTNSDCTGNCDICSSGNCEADVTLCTGNCDVCPEVSATEFNCAASNSLCSNSVSSCYCSGSGTAFNCQLCPDTYGVCGYPTCGTYTCGNTAYNDGTNCGTNKWCYSASCLVSYCDEDNDGHYTTSAAQCPSGRFQSTIGDDCNDSCATCYPGSTSWTMCADGLDQDCDGSVDETSGTSAASFSCCAVGGNCACGNTSTCCPNTIPCSWYESHSIGATCQTSWVYINFNCRGNKLQ